MSIKYIFYDLDGVLVDAVEWHYVALNDALKKISNYEITRHDHDTTYNGLPTKNKLHSLAVKDLIKEEDIERIFDLKQEYTVDVINRLATPDLTKIKLHEYTKNIGIVSACVTNSIIMTADLALTKTGQRSYMHAVIGNDMVTKNKPFPEPYLKAISIFNAPVHEIIVFEDTDKGVMSAKSAGLNVIKVKDSSEVTLENIQKYLM